MTEKEESKSTADKGIKDYPINERNPFMDTLVVETRQKTYAVSKKKLALIDVETEQQQIAFIGAQKQIDKEKFVKLFVEQIKVIFNLSSAGIKVFGYFLVSATKKISDDEIVFDFDECVEFTGYSKGNKESIYKGLRELLENQIIARSKMVNVYFINPAIFFNGDRMVIVNEYIAIRSNKPNELTEDQQLKLRLLNP